MFKLLLSVAALVAPVTPAWAQTSSWEIDGMVGVVSDYRYRGYSLSAEDPALQAGLTASHDSGFYGDAFVSTIDEYGVDQDGDGAKVEVTLSAGWAGVVAGLDVDAAVSAYRYPDGDDVNYVEAPVQVSQTLGALSWTLGLSYAPAQAALGEDDNRYGWVGLDFAPEGWPLSFNGGIGYEEGAFAPDGKTDWSLGVARSFGPVALGLTWVDSDEYDGRAVASASVGF